MADKKTLSLQEMMDKMYSDMNQKRISESLRQEELQKQYNEQRKYMEDNRRMYQNIGGRLRTTPSILQTFLGASTNNTYYDPDGNIVSTITSEQNNLDNGVYPTNSIAVNKLYNLDTTSTSYTESLNVYQHSVFAYNTDDNMNYFIGYDGVDTKFGKIDTSGNVTIISDFDTGNNTPITQLLYVGSNTFLYYTGLGNTTQMWEIDTNGVFTLSTNFASPAIGTEQYLTSINIIDGIYYVFIKFYLGAYPGSDTVQSLYCAQYNQLDGSLSNEVQVTMVALPSEITGDIFFKVVDLVSATSDYNFPNTTGNKVYANILVADQDSTVDLSSEYYYFIVEIDVTTGDATYITNGDNVFDLSYYKKLI